MKVSGVYAIWNALSGKVYVGLSVDIVSRWGQHRRKLRSGTHSNPYLQAAWKIDGEESFRFEILLEEPDRSLLPALEIGWIARLNSFDRTFGYNLDGSSGENYIMSPETKIKIGTANRGKVRTEEMRLQMSLIKKGQGKGRVKSDEEIANLREAHARRSKDPNGYSSFRTPEAIERLRIAGSRGAASRWKKEKPDGS